MGITSITIKTEWCNSQGNSVIRYWCSVSLFVSFVLIVCPLNTCCRLWWYCWFDVWRWNKNSMKRVDARQAVRGLTFCVILKWSDENMEGKDSAQTCMASWWEMDGGCQPINGVLDFSNDSFPSILHQDPEHVLVHTLAARLAEISFYWILI